MPERSTAPATEPAPRRGQGAELAALAERAWRAAQAHAGALTALALVALAARSFQLRWSMLTTSPYPLGIDGYFYATQLRSVLETGHLAMPASPLAFWLMAPLAALTDPIVGAKLGAAAAGAAAVWPAYALGKRLGPGRWAGLAAAVVAMASTGSLMLTVDFIKNSFGVAFGLAALAALLAALERPTSARVAAAVGAALAAVLAHKTAAGLAVVAGGPALVAWLWARGGAARKGGVAALGALAAAALVAGALWPERLLSPGQLALVGELFGGPWRWGAPALEVGSFRLGLGGEVWQAGALCALAVGVTAVRRGAAPAPTRAARHVTWALLCLGLVLAWPTLAVSDPQGLGFRLRLVAFVPMAVAAAALVGRLAGASASADAGRPHPALGPRLVVALALVGAAARAPQQLARGVVYAHPAMISAVCGLASAVPRGDLVLVSERHIAFMATWYARVDTAVRPQTPPRHKWRLMPLAFIGERTPLARALAAARARPDLVPPRGLHPRHRDGLVLVAEPTWQWILTQLPPAARAHYQAWRAL